MTPEAVADHIRARTGPAPIEVAIVLGSGLSGLCDAVTGAASLPYATLPGFPMPGVSGHAGQLVVGQLGGRRVAALAGRAHYYESGRPDAMRVALEVVRALGVGTVVLTNAAGALRADLRPGGVMLIADHIGLWAPNPLVGNPSDTGFVDMGAAYDPALRAALAAAAEAEGIALPQGVYAWCSGPSFETPAEIRALRHLGADAVGMSTVPEVILARHLGLRVAGLSIITNMAAGLSDVPLSHAQTQAVAPTGGALVQRILTRWLAGGAPATAP
ncbi:purine-nucleoside phosphorylase [Rhodobaculum claviforme]|uniref:Purine nucleoside phosphorylase n=1 Tax=Rhodobaculum claviforme TaxID=1549854 RepID=A0A934TKB8_9RHOB|nr:purine-nucleoside phosphorylase [Rhodobaculum claviforme]